MGVHIEDKKTCSNNRAKTIHSDLPKDVENNLKHEIDFIIKDNESLDEQAIKNDISMKTTFMNTKN